MFLHLSLHRTGSLSLRFAPPTCAQPTAPVQRGLSFTRSTYSFRFYSVTSDTAFLRTVAIFPALLDIVSFPVLTTTLGTSGPMSPLFNKDTWGLDCFALRVVVVSGRLVSLPCHPPFGSTLRALAPVLGGDLGYPSNVAEPRTRIRRFRHRPR